MEKLLVRAVRGEDVERPPVWLMRQAGRHIPEYREIREEYSFLEAIKTPEVAERITLLPWEHYRPDGVVMFSDILTVLEPLGFDYRIESGVGPVIEDPFDGPSDVPDDYAAIADELDYVGALLERLDDAVGDETSLIGFAGGPFTLASYIIASGSSRHDEIRQFRARHPDAFASLLDIIADAVLDSLQYQIDHGADVVQLFDTYAGELAPADYREFLLPLHRRICAGVDAPIILFVRNMAGRLDALADADPDAVSLDWTVDIADARDELGDIAVQGNLDPQYLFGDESFVRAETEQVIEAAGPRGHVLNLGHGVHADTPMENVRAFVETAKNWEYEN